jgi:hypothetical protein
VVSRLGAARKYVLTLSSQFLEREITSAQTAVHCIGMSDGLISAAAKAARALVMASVWKSILNG